LQFRPRGYESLADDFDVRPGPSGHIDNRTIELHTYPTYILTYPSTFTAPRSRRPFKPAATNRPRPCVTISHGNRHVPPQPAGSFLPPPQRARCWLVCPGCEHRSAIATRHCIVPFPSWLGPRAGHCVRWAQVSGIPVVIELQRRPVDRVPTCRCATITSIWHRRAGG
jgi:hypothetical protein